MAVVKTVRLTTPALSTCGGESRSHEARLELRDLPIGQFGASAAEELTRQFSYRWSLIIEDAPGCWLMSTLLVGGKIPERLSLDLGLGWTLTNAGDVIREAIEHI